MTILALRLPGRSLDLAIIGAPEAAVIGPVTRPAKSGAHPDAETMRWRKLLEGSRVVSLCRRDRWFRLTLVRAGEARAIVATPTGALIFVGSGAATSEDEGSVVSVADEDSLAVEAERALATVERARLDRRRRALIAAIDRAHKKLARRAAAVEADLAKIGDADALIARATLLSSNAHSIPRGAATASIDDWSTGERVPISLTLDPSLTAREQADALFRRAKRMKRGAPIARARLEEAHRAAKALTPIAELARAAEDDEALEKAERRAIAAGALAARAQTTKGAVDRPAERLPYTTFHSGERPVHVGRGAKDNDALTTRVARSHDLWLHVKGFTGAHVIVPLAKGEACPAELLVDAAHLAAHFSDARGETVVDVMYVPRRYVRKPRGAAPGAVVVEREKVLVLRVEPARLTRLLPTGGAL